MTQPTHTVEPTWLILRKAFQDDTTQLTPHDDNITSQMTIEMQKQRWKARMTSADEKKSNKHNKNWMKLVLNEKV
jgi:hypothetical protein